MNGETPRPAPTGRMWVGPLGSTGWSDRFEPVGQADGGMAFNEFVPPPRGLFELRSEVAPCLHCRAPVVIIDGVIRRPVRIWEADGRIMVTAHREGCPAIEQQAPEGLLLR